jgi:hypothetical protein
LVKEGVEFAGMETMQSFKSRIKEGIIQQDIEGMGFEKS